MDPFGAFKSEVFRPIASTVLPGMLALSGFAVLLANAVPEVFELYRKEPLIFFAFFFGAATIVGMLLENVGSSIERGIDTCMEREYLPGSEAVWAAYLASECKDCYARKYLGALVTRLKFINSTIPATILFGLGFYMLHTQIKRWSSGTVILIEIFLALFVSWLFKTSVELSEAALFSRLKMLPSGHGIRLDTDAHTVSRFRHFAYAITELRTSRIEELDLKNKTGIHLFIEILRVLLPFTRKTRAP